MPHGFCKTYMPGWDTTCDNLAEKHKNAKTQDEINETAKELLNHIDIPRKSNWEDNVNEIDMKHSSRVAWQTINRLTGRNKKMQNSNDIKAKDMAKCLINNNKTAGINHEFTYCMNREIKQLWNSLSADSHLCNDFSTKELKRALGDLKNGKAPGVDKMHTEFLKNLAASTKGWFLSFFK